MKKSIMMIMVGACATVATAAIPAGYYDDAVGKSGKALQTTLADIIDHSDPGYSALWEIYETTDRRSNGKVWDMYSNTTNFTFGSDQCGNYSGEGDCYNREHTIPKSWRDGNNYSDVHVVVPTDGYVNSRRSNYPFGEVSSSSYTSDNSFSKVGSCKTSGYSGMVFEPNDEYKGDFARIYFYVATRYYDECGSWGGDGFSSSFPYLDEWVRKMMLRWHELDPVSEKEIDRNDAVYESRQGNRNPFVDYPELVDLIFGDLTTTPFDPDGSLATAATLISPVDGAGINMGTLLLSDIDASSVKTINVEGENMSQTLNISISGSSYFTVSPTTLTAAAVESGADVTITYVPLSAGTHTATMTLSGGGMRKSVSVSITGSAAEDFAALSATEISDTSFKAQWARHSQADDYELAVWTISEADGVERTLFDADFSRSLPQGWSTSGYTNFENNALRMASGSNDGLVKSPSIDLSAGGTLTVTCSPYRTTDNSILYILVDGKNVAEVDCSVEEVTESVELASATESSIITLMAENGSRVYLKRAVLITGGAGEVMLDGYPRRVGNVLSYLVDNLIACRSYYYHVTAYNGNTKIETSNEIEVSTGMTSVEHIESDFDNMFVYAYNGSVVIDDAPYNARVNCYSLDGVLCTSRTIHDVREYIDLNNRGIYIVQVVTDNACYATRVAVY